MALQGTGMLYPDLGYWKPHPYLEDFKFIIRIGNLAIAWWNTAMGQKVKFQPWAIWLIKLDFAYELRSQEKTTLQTKKPMYNTEIRSEIDERYKEFGRGETVPLVLNTHYYLAVGMFIIISVLLWVFSCVFLLFLQFHFL